MFPDYYQSNLSTTTSVQEESLRLVELSKQHLALHNIPFAEKRPAQAIPHLKNLPPLQGNSIEEHFWRIGDMISRTYYSIAVDFAQPSSIMTMDMDWMKGRWSSRPGWTKYTPNGDEIGPIEPFDEDAIVLDVETCKSFGPWPLLAVAFSKGAIYSWTSPWLFSSPSTNPPTHRLISIKTTKPLLIIGHNVSYDRARIVEEYSLIKGSFRFLDTLSMHCAVGGLSSQQRGIWKSQKLKTEEENVPLHDTPSESRNSEHWYDLSSMSNLADAVELHCNHVIDKSPRDWLVKGSLNDVRENFQHLMTYCANDVAATKGLYSSVWPKFLEKCPHPVTFAAILEMGSCFLPVNGTWTEYVDTVDEMHQQSIDNISNKLRELVESICREGQEHDKWKKDPWLSRLDWTLIPARYTKERRKVDGTYAKGGEPRPIGTIELFGKPAWYRKLWCSKSKRPEITPKTRIVPYLMRMRWNGHPVHFLEPNGWCYFVPKDSTVLGTETPVDTDENFVYYKIPHHESEHAKVGSLMTKQHLKYYEKGVLTTDSALVQEIMQTSCSYSFWVGYRERIKDQFVVWNDEPGADLGFTSGGKAGMILPSLITMGTVTRRAVEPTWMTATNPKKKLVGSELKSKIIAPDHFVFVGADVDSQELWISSLLGDAKFGFPGATALGWMTLQGTKADNTDLHSHTALILGMSRDDAKIFNYGRIYGAGVKYAAQLLQKFNPSLTKEEARSKAERLYSATKGRACRKGTTTMYIGGTETFMFNVLEAIANSNVSKTPTLSASISNSLASYLVHDDYLTSRVNWAVQSSGVDYLHMLLVSTAYLALRYSINMRLALTIHDEVRFLVKEEDQYRAALALQIANCWTRTMFAHRVGMLDLPLSVAFFSAVDFDKVLRKETTIDCITPSNSKPVPHGRALNIHNLLPYVPDGLGSENPEFDKLTRKSLRRFKPLDSVVDKATQTKELNIIRKQIGLSEEKSTESSGKNTTVRSNKKKYCPHLAHARIPRKEQTKKVEEEFLTKAEILFSCKSHPLIQ